MREQPSDSTQPSTQPSDSAPEPSLAEQIAELFELDAPTVPDIDGFAPSIHSRYRFSAYRTLTLWWGCKHYGCTRWSRWPGRQPPTNPLSLGPAPSRSVEPEHIAGGVWLI